MTPSRLVERTARAALVLGLITAALLCSSATGAEGTSRIVLFDEGHGQRFLVGQEGELDLSGLGKMISEARGRTEAVRDPLTAEVLSGACPGGLRPLRSPLHGGAARRPPLRP